VFGDASILIVDDERDNIDVLKLFLMKKGFNVLTALNGPEALRICDEVLPELVILDVMMGGMDGFEVCQRLKSRPDTARIPIIFLSAKAEATEKVKGFQAGGADYVTKPYSFQELEARIISNLLKKRADDELYNRATNDALTGVLNRGSLYDRLQRMSSEDGPLSCVMLDIDHFKKINDTYGHATGDEVLRHVAKVLMASCRQVDAVGRYGGEEFVVAMSGTPLSVAKTVAERIRKAIAGSPVMTDKGEIVVTASLGVALYSRRTGIDDVVDRADKALYHSKQTGRNRVSFEEAGDVKHAG